MPILQLSSPSIRIAVSVGMLGLIGLSLPIRLPSNVDERSSERCLSLADRPPENGPETLMQLEQCNTAVPDDVELLADLGGAYEAAGRADDAVTVYRRALALDPEYADVRVRLAHLLLRRGNRHEASEQAAAALRVQPNRRAIEELIRQTAVSP